MYTDHTPPRINELQSDAFYDLKMAPDGRGETSHAHSHLGLGFLFSCHKHARNSDGAVIVTVMLLLSSIFIQNTIYNS